MLDSSQAQLEVQDEDAIIEAMQSSGLDGQNDSGSEKSKVGQIVVEIRRIRLGLKKYDPNYRPKHEEGKDVDIDMDGVESGITHATGFSYANTLARSPLPTVEYLDYIPGEGLWATFQFFYRSAGMGHFPILLSQCRYGPSQILQICRNGYHMVEECIQRSQRVC